MEDQNQTNPPADEIPQNPPSSSDMPVVPSEPASEPPPSPETPISPETPPTAVTPSATLPGGSGSYTPPPTTPTPSYNYTPAAPSPETNAWAIVSLIASILSWVGLFGIGGIVGIIAGMVARNEIRASNGRQGGDGLAVAGIILGVANIVIACGAILCGILFFGSMFAFRRG